MSLARTILILLGPPGAGKGTQAKRLSAELSLPHVSTGDLFREHLGKRTDLGRRAREYVDSGRLVPDGLVVDMVFERVERPDARGGYLLDGFPRTVGQAEELERRLEPDAELRVLDLAVPDEVLIDRLTARLTCRDCGNAHHLRFSPPEREGRCDRCGGELYQRPDDSPAVVEKRLQVYRAETRPLTRFYAQRGVLRSVDGDRAPEEVFTSLMRAVRGEAA
jgi:adenylate kinase